MPVAVTMFKLLFTICLGAFLNRKGLLTSDISKKLSSVIVDVTAPLLVLASVGSVEGGDRDAVLLMLLGGAAFYCAFPLLGWLGARLLRAPGGTRGVFMCALMFANTAFMGYPVVESLYGAQAIFYTTIFNFGFNPLYYLLADYLMGRDAGKTASFDLRQILSPGLLTGVLAIVIYLTGIPLPELIMEPCSFVGSLTSPLSMLIIGANMAGCSLREVFGERRVYAAAALRLLVMPLLSAFVLSLFSDNGLLISMAAMTLGMPVAAMVAMAGGRYEETAKLSNVCVVMSTLCSMLTIPAVALIFRFWFGV